MTAPARSTPYKANAKVVATLGAEPDTRKGPWQVNVGWTAR